MSQKTQTMIEGNVNFEGPSPRSFAPWGVENGGLQKRAWHLVVQQDQVQNPGHYTQAHVGVFNYPEHTVVPKGLRHLGPMGPLATGGTDMYPAKTPRGNWLGSEGLISATRIQMPGKTSGRKTSFEKLNLPSNKAEKSWGLGKGTSLLILKHDRRTSLAKKQKHCTKVILTIEQWLTFNYPENLKGSRKSRKCINPTEEQDLTCGLSQKMLLVYKNSSNWTLQGRAEND